ncbi:hypothetical protein BHUM_04454c [Candidatus Burkholderia humilis]|nr:hypothetical protein BHUM_04454c [Candidatus Burkholderia humilis]
MAETLMRGRFRGLDAGAPHVIEERAILDRCVATIEPRAPRILRLADLTQPLWQFGFNTQVLSTPEYSAQNQWSVALHDNANLIDGIYFRSRFANATSVAIFDDRVQMTQQGRSTPLRDYPGLASFLDRFNVGIADPSGVAWRSDDD